MTEWRFQAKALERLRRAAGWSQADLARRAGVSRRTVSKLEGYWTESPRFETVSRLAGTLGVDPDLLIRPGLWAAHVATVRPELARRWSEEERRRQAVIEEAGRLQPQIEAELQRLGIAATPRGGVWVEVHWDGEVFLRRSSRYTPPYCRGSASSIVELLRGFDARLSRHSVLKRLRAASGIKLR